MQRCNGNASACSSFSSNSAGLGSSRHCFVDGHSSVKRRQEDQCVLERNRSARYSPGQHADNGMLRFYLTPMRSGGAGARRGGWGGFVGDAWGRGVGGGGRHLRSQSFARSMLRLY